MKTISRRDFWAAFPALAALAAVASTAAEAHASEPPAGQSGQPDASPVPASDTPALPMPAAGTMGASRAFSFDQMAARATANGAESRGIAHGTLATGESVNLHQSMQAVGAVPSSLHVIRHSEFVLVREGELELQREVAGQMVSEKVGPGGVFYVAFGARHALKNVGMVPARYFVVAIGGDAK